MYSGKPSDNRLDCNRRRWTAQAFSSAARYLLNNWHAEVSGARPSSCTFAILISCRVIRISISQMRRSLSSRAKSTIGFTFHESFRRNMQAVRGSGQTYAACPKAARTRSGVHHPLMARISGEPSTSRPSVGSQKSIPKEVDHSKIAVRATMVDEVQFLFASEPGKSLKARSFHVIFLVEKDMHVERK